MNSIQIAREIGKGPQITSEYLASIPYASTLVSINDANPLLLILSQIDENPISGTKRLTWLSADKGTIVTEHGHIIHTTGFPSDNLDTLLSKAHSLTFPNGSHSWQAIYDWSPGYRYNFSAQVNSQDLGMETLTTDLWTQTTQHIQENVTFTALNSKFSNHFWVAAETQTNKAFVVKSIQYLGPEMDKVEMLMIKPFIELKQDETQKANNKDGDS